MTIDPAAAPLAPPEPSSSGPPAASDDLRDMPGPEPAAADSHGDPVGDVPDFSQEPAPAVALREGDSPARTEAESLAAPAPAPRESAPPPLPESLLSHFVAIEGALSLIARASARLSAQAGGIRFANIQKQDNQVRSALRWVRNQAAVPAADLSILESRLRDLLSQVERLTGLLVVPPQPAAVVSPGDESSPPVTAQQAAGIRQSVTRAMIALATAPLHLQVEFGPAFADPRPDALLLAARMHAIHRNALGSLKQVRWDAIDRASLAFGDANSPQRVEAVFDARGALQLPDAFRQNPGRSAPAAVPPRQPSPKPERGRPEGSKPDSSKPDSGKPQRRNPDPRRPQSGRQPGAPAAANGGNAVRQPVRQPDRQLDRKVNGPQPRQGSRVGDKPRSERAPGHSPRHGGPPSGPATGRPPSQAQADPRAPRPRSPLNTSMADKLRAALVGSASPEKPADSSARVPVATPVKGTGDASDE